MGERGLDTKVETFFVISKRNTFAQCRADTLLVLFSLNLIQGTVYSSVADPDPYDPYVFEPPGSGSGSISHRYGSGSFYHQATVVKKR